MVCCGIAKYARGMMDWDLNWQVRLDEIPPEQLRHEINLAPDGIITTIHKPELRSVLQQFACPVVYVGPVMGRDGVPFVGIDNGKVGTMAADYFGARGFKSFGCAFFDQPNQRWRKEAFGSQLQEKGAHPVSSYCVRSLHENVPDLCAWLGKLNLPAAVFCTNDVLGCHVSYCARLAGLHVPNQIALMGVDNDEPRCLLAHPPLSSIKLPNAALGNAAAQQLDVQMRGGNPLSESLLLPPLEVITRSSSDIFAVQDPQVARALQVIRQRFSEPLAVDDILKGIPVSRRQMERRFCDVLDCGILDILHQIRVDRARELLLHSKLSVTEIAFGVGFGSLASFYRIFSSVAGMKPTVWRKQMVPLTDVFASELGARTLD
jgi:LacI family transcriptional regulator